MISFCMLGSIRLAGRMLFGYGVCVTGSLIVVVPKLPLLNAAVGTVQVVVAPVLMYFRSSLKKKNSFSRSVIESRARNDDRPADVAAGIVPAQFRLSDGGGIVRVRRQVVVAPVLVEHSVKVLGAAADGDVHHGAGTGSGFGAEVARQDAELADGIGVDVDEVIAASAVVLIVAAVQVPGRGVGAAAVNRLAAVIDTVAAEQAEAVGVSGRNAGQELE